MILKTLTLRASDSAPLPKDVHIRSISHPITEIFMTFLPKVEINGSSKIVVVLGPKGDEGVFDNVLGVTNIFFEDFDFKKFLSLDRSSQNIELLKHLSHGLVTIATRRGENPDTTEIINKTAAEVLKTNFDIKIPIKKLSKTIKNSKNKINVFRVLNSEVGEGWYCEVAESNSLSSNRNWMHEVPGCIDRRNNFKTAEINENLYLIKNNLGNISFELQLP